MGHHLSRMNARIRTSRPHHGDRAGTQNLRQRLLQHLLNRDAVGLDLPSVKTGSVITERDEITHVKNCESLFLMISSGKGITIFPFYAHSRLFFLFLHIKTEEKKKKEHEIV